MGSETVSVILPTYNRARLIGETLDSLLGQSRPPDEILVINDGSSDDTEAVLAGYGARLTVISQQNAGKATSLNRALARVRGGLVWVIDDDDILMPDACAQLAGALEADPALEFCAGKHLDFTHDPIQGRRDTRPPGYMRDSVPERIFPDLLEGCHIFQPGLMVRRSVYDTVGPFRSDLVRSQDYEMILRIARRHRGRQLDKVVFWHREHDGQRGQAGQQFAANSNADRWAEYNRLIFEELLADLADPELFAPQEWSATPEAERARLGRVARATVRARQRIWDHALADLHDAAEMSARAPSAAERALLARATLSSLGVENLLQSHDLHRHLRSLKRKGPFGAESRRILRRSIAWQLRAAAKARDTARLGQLLGFFVRS